MRLRRMIGDVGASAVEYAILIAAVAALLIPVSIALTELIGNALQSNCQQTASQNGSTDPEGDCE